MAKLKNPIEGFKNFLHEVRVELAKCVWPTREELTESTIVVIVAVILLGFFVGISDLLLMTLLRQII